MIRSYSASGALTSIAALGVLLAGSAVGTPRSLAQSVPRGVALFPHQAAITEPPANGRLVRLPLPPEMLADARADLSDVRIHDASGEEVPYAIDPGTDPRPASPVGEPRVLVPYDATEQTSRAGGVTTTRETYRLRAPAQPSYGSTWELAIEADTPELLRRFVIRAEPPFGQPRVIDQGAIFRFPSHGSARMTVRLPGVADEPLMIELSGEGAALHPRFLLREVDRVVMEPAHVSVPLTIQETRREGTRTILVVDRPVGYPTESIRLASSTASFIRPIEVSSTPRGGTRVVLGRGSLVRLAGLDAPELLSVRLTQGGGDAIEISIEDGDSPALAELTVTAEIRVPSLLYDPDRARLLRWGGSRSRAPHYDLMSMNVASVVQNRDLVTASLGAPEPNPEFDATPALTFAMRAGQVVHLERYTHRAPLAVAGARDGLSRFRVPPAVWAEAREDLEDLRVIDADGRQWPYMSVSAPGEDELEARVSAGVESAADPDSTTHEITLPVRAMSPVVIRIELPAQLISRRVTAHGRRPDGVEQVLGEASFYTSADAPARVEVPLFGERVVALWLEIENGDEAPLAIDRVVLVMTAHEFQLVAPAGEYAVVVGDLEADAPNYDLYSAESVLALLEADEATLGELVPNAAYHEPTFFERSGWETVVLSLLLGLVVIVLFGFTMRVARSEEPPAAVAASGSAASGSAAAPEAAPSSAPGPSPEPSPGPSSEPSPGPSPEPSPEPAPEPSPEVTPE